MTHPMQKQPTDIFNIRIEFYDLPDEKRSAIMTLINKIVWQDLRKQLKIVHKEFLLSIDAEGDRDG